MDSVTLSWAGPRKSFKQYSSSASLPLLFPPLLLLYPFLLPFPFLLPLLSFSPHLCSSPFCFPLFRGLNALPKAARRSEEHCELPLGSGATVLSIFVRINVLIYKFDYICWYRSVQLLHITRPFSISRPCSWVNCDAVDTQDRHSLKNL